MYTFKVEIREKLGDGTAGALVHRLPGTYESADEERAQNLATDLSNLHQATSGYEETLGVVVPV